MGPCQDHLAHGLQAHHVAPGGELGQHAGHGLSPEQLRRGHQLVGGQGDLGCPIGASQPGPADGHPPAPEGHQAVVAAVAHGSAPWIVAALGAGDGGGLGLDDHMQHLEARAHHESEQALLELADEIGDGDSDGVGQCDRRLCRPKRGVELRLLRGRMAVSRETGGVLVVVLHDGPPPRRMSSMDARHLPPGRSQAGDRHSTSMLSGTASLDDWVTDHRPAGVRSERLLIERTVPSPATGSARSSTTRPSTLASATSPPTSSATPSPPRPSTEA